MLIRPLGTNFSEICIKMHTFSLEKDILKYCLQNDDQFAPAPMYWLTIPLNTDIFHDANLVITGGTRGCHYDNLWCHKWQQS